MCLTITKAVDIDIIQARFLGDSMEESEMPLSSLINPFHNPHHTSKISRIIQPLITFVIRLNIPWKIFEPILICINIG